MLAKSHNVPGADTRLLSDHPSLAGVNKVVVWGAGRMVEEMLQHFFDPTRIDFFIDKDVSKHGTLRLGAPVRGPESLNRGSNWIVLINSLENETPIRADIEQNYHAHVGRVVGIAELFE